MRDLLELLVAGHEIGLGIDLDGDALVAIDGKRDQALGRDTAGLLRGFREALLAQPIDRSFDIGVRFRQCRLAIHHSGAGLFAQLFHQCRRDIRHWLHPSINSIRAKRMRSIASALSERVAYSAVIRLFACSIQPSRSIRPPSLRS